MPKRLHIPSDGKLRDVWGRENRKLIDRRCVECGKVFRPWRESGRYCSTPCARKKNGGHNKKDGPIWWKDAKGYIVGLVWVHSKRRQVRQHRWIMERVIGRPLASHENVHHINGDKTDNRIENLEIMHHGQHSTLHNKSRVHKKGYKMNLSQEERERRSEHMRTYQANRRANAEGKEPTP